ncbi:MAG TPA: His/Gly/Thr/Pro-type tRNA ligase C-terminal domain-containing protein, partial [Candidatus Limnocylindria bacterium]|nr:His/Gly/Thr/Pro-type tRNA ligase C-terminal domain-containing protein [Candidatus Limnocylindria bacterium]
GICNLCQQRKEKNVLRVFDCKTPGCQEIYQKAPHTTDSLCPECAQEWTTLRQQLELLSVSFVHKPTLVRGLDYYNKTVFEFVSDSLGSQNAFCAGGRYDSLIAQVGGKEDQPSLGAAIGIERLMMVLETYKDTVQLPHLPALHVIMPLSPAQEGLALILADELQAHGLTTEVMLEGGSIKSMMRKANKLGAKFCLLLGSDEQAAREVTLKNMVTGQEQRVAQNTVVTTLKNG